MLRLLTTLALVFQLAVLSAYNPNDYIYPVEGAARLFAGNFGELRANHFHSGVDIKTDGVEGKRVVAASDGYVSRISLSPSGYGLALYIAHANGSTTVYGHLSKLREDIEMYLQSERYRTKQNSLNLYLKAAQFPVKKGELVAFSGNSGSSGGPHVHFEVRDGAQRPLNPVAMGVISPTDSIAPLVFNVYYAETQTIDGVCYTKGISKYPVTQVAPGEYKLADRDVMWVGREGYFIFETSDRRNGVTNTFGAYAITAKIDDQIFYSYQQDRFSFAQTRYCNAISYYPYQYSTRSEFFRLKRLEAMPREMVKQIENSGVITTKVGDTRNVEIEVMDDMKNSSKLCFTIRGKDDVDCFKATPVADNKIVRPSRNFVYNDGDVVVSMPPGVVYEPVVFALNVEEVVPSSGVKVYSKDYEVMDPTIPLHSAIKISIKADVPAEERSHVMMITKSRGGALSAVSASYSGGLVSTSTRTLGSYFVAVDDVAPQITPLFEEGASLVGANKLSLKVSDNFSGVSSYKASIDGEWIAIDQRGSTLTHHFRTDGDGELHELVVTVTDMCKNSTTIKRNFRR